MRRLSFNVNVLRSIASDGYTKSFALYLILKSGYINGCIYGWSINKIYQKFGFSRAYLKKEISLFLSKGWCREHSGNLVFCPVKSFDEHKEKRIQYILIRKGAKVVEITNNLRLLILNDANNRFQGLKKIRHDYNRRPNLKAYKSAKRAIDRLGVSANKLPNENANYTASINHIAKLFGCSPATASVAINGFKKNQDVLCIAGFRRLYLEAPPPALIKSVLGSVSGAYYYCGNIYKTQCNQYIFG